MLAGMENGGLRPDIPALNSALQAQGARGDCLICGGLEWRTATEYAAIPATTSDTPTIECYLMTCANCGFVRLHSAVALHGDI